MDQHSRLRLFCAISVLVVELASYRLVGLGRASRRSSADYRPVKKEIHFPDSFIDTLLASGPAVPERT